MAVDVMVEGPAWTGQGVEESAGRYPLRVEGAIFRLVEQLLPGIITTTRQARMYGLHALAWPEAHARGLNREESEAFVRRCEVVLAAIHAYHAPHRIELSTAHGEGEIPRFVRDGVLDVEAASRPGGLSANGFGDIYLGPAIKVGLLSPEYPPREGERSDLATLRDGLGDLLPMAERDTIPVDELGAAAHLCPCAGPESADGLLIRRVLFEDVGAERADDRYRQLTCHMLLDAIAAEPALDVDYRFRRQWGFGFPPDDPEASDAAYVARGWRAAILRNYSVRAWRTLWRWLAAELRLQPMTVEELGQALADALGDLSVRDLVDGLPERVSGAELLPAEAVIDEEELTPLNCLRLLALGAKRLEDLDDPTRKLFVGTDTSDLGPRWVAARLREWEDSKIEGFARELAEILVRRAKRVALNKMRLVNGRPWVPSRLRDRDGLLTVRGDEGAGDVALRTWSLAQILTGVGALRRNEDGAMELTLVGEALHERTT